MEFTIYTSNFTGNAKNCYYPHKVTVENAADLEEAVKLDHVCASFKKG